VSDFAVYGDKLRHTVADLLIATTAKNGSDADDADSMRSLEI
jgi:hypothetical protein